VDDDEPTLLMATLYALHDVEPEPEQEATEEVAVVEQGKASYAIYLDESRAQVHLGRVGSGME
jgi:hypothetical protein